MEFLKIPTDSLYKFMALIGLFIFAASLISFSWLNHSISINLIHNQTELNIFSANFDYLKNEIEQAEQSKVKVDVKILKDAILKLNLQHLQTQGKNTELQYLAKILNIVRIDCVILAFTGIVLAILGFKLWYSRIQLYQDTIIQSEAQTILREKQLAESKQDKDSK